MPKTDMYGYGLTSVRKVAELKREGLSVPKIAQAMGIKQETVRDLMKDPRYEPHALSKALEIASETFEGGIQNFNKEMIKLGPRVLSALGEGLEHQDIQVKLSAARLFLQWTGAQKEQVSQPTSINVILPSLGPETDVRSFVSEPIREAISEEKNADHTIPKG